MYRNIYDKLLEWKNKQHRKPLVLNGARQVGKTYILKEFGQNEYEKLAMISLDRNKNACSVIERGGEVGYILKALSAISSVDITPGNTLLVLDEVQACPQAIELLKYLCEDAPEYHVAVAGSLLGVSLHEGISFSVGKIDELHLYPMVFDEFIRAMGKPHLADALKFGDWAIIDALGEELATLLRQYYYVGGMPAAVNAYVEHGGPSEVRHIQKQILSDYRRDFSKHVPAKDVLKVNMVWDSIPAQLSKENKKFVYGAMKKGARASEYENAIQWLIDAGLAYKVSRISKPRLPLKFYEDFSAFKLFMLDCGLMGAMVDASAESMLASNDIFVEYKGAFSELYVYTQLIEHDLPIYYHSVDNSTIEIDFVLSYCDKVVPIEVKAEENVRSKSLRTFIKNNPDLRGLRLSMRPRDSQDWMDNYPLYACQLLFREK